MYNIATFYRFTPIDDPETVCTELERFAGENGLTGSILVAEEGVNCMLAAEAGKLTAPVDELVARFDVSRVRIRWTNSAEQPFRRMTVRRKSEIVSLGVPGIDPNSRVGHYVAPAKWDSLIARDDVVLIDCRNDYEVAIGTFEGARDPGTSSFREFPDFAASLDPGKNPRVAMFCTGGIRCEKATSLLLERGFEEVYHLEGGILRYLEEVGPQSSTWRGECFVFDRRVSVDSQLRSGSYDLCFACRMPVDSQAKADERYEPGVSCPACFGDWTAQERAAKRERHLQFVAQREQG